VRFSQFAKYQPLREAHVYLFVCGDDFLVEESRPVWARIFGGDWGFERVSAKEFEAIEPRALVEAALSPPLFGPSRALLISDAEKIPAKKAAVVEEVALLPSSSLKIVFVAASNRSLPRWGGKLPKVEIDPVRPADAVKWLGQRFGLSAEVSAYLVETLGSELRPLAGEAEKLATFVRGSRPVEVSDVDLLTWRIEQFSTFDLDDAVLERDYRKAVRVMEAMIDEGMEPLVVLARLARVWRQLLAGKSLAGRVSPAEAARSASVPHWKASAFVAACARFSRESIDGGFRELVRTDKQFKTSGSDPALVLNSLLWRLLGADRSPAAMPRRG
jgi:DNA polymerase III delta subunit